MSVSPIRTALGAHLGQFLTPELAAHIECAAVAPARLPAFLDPGTGKFLVESEGPTAIRQWVLSVVREMLAVPADRRIEPELKHTFLDGIYMREMHIPRGTLVVGKVHRQACMNVVSKGDISILTEAGSARVLAGHSAMSLAGTQKVGYAHEDTVFINVFRTDETDVARLEDTLALTDEQCMAWLEQGNQRSLK